jgi:hypothetical protein
VLLIDLFGGFLDGFSVSGVLGDVFAGRLAPGEECDLFSHLGVSFEHTVVGVEASDDVLREVHPVYAEEELAGEVSYGLFLL